MNKKDLWKLFMKTGKVSDYLRYKNARDNSSFAIDDEEEYAEEIEPEIFDDLGSDDYGFEEDVD